MSMDHLHRVKLFEILYFAYDAVLKSLLLIQLSFFQITNSQSSHVNPGIREAIFHYKQYFFH